MQKKFFETLLHERLPNALSATSLNWHDQESFWEKTMIFQFDPDRWHVPEQVKQLEKLLKLKKTDHILDLCCGPGRLILPLSKKYDMTGVELIPAYVKAAKEYAKKYNLSPTILQGDMRTFVQKETFDVILNLFTSFGYFKDQKMNQKVLDNAYASLKKGGTFAMEIRSAEVYKRIFRPRDWEEKNGVFLLKDRIPMKNWSWLSNPWTLIESGKVTRFNVEHHLYTKEHLLKMFNKAGFRTVKAYGGLDGSKFDPKTSNNLVLVAKKTA